MNILQKIFSFYINASIHVALAVYAFLRLTEQYVSLPYNENLNYFIFFGTITGYNFVKYAGVAKLHHRSLTNNLKIIQIFSLICFIVMCYYMCLVPFITLLFSLPFTFLTILYAIPFLSGFDKNLRQISYLKIIVVALVWTGFTVLIPYFDTAQTLTYNLFLLSLQRFLIVVVLILPFDIRDVNKSGAVFDIEKLNWMNGKYIRDADLDRIVDMSIPYLKSAGYIKDENSVDREWLEKVIEVARTGVDFLEQIPREAELFFTELEFEDKEEAKEEFSEEGVELVFDSLKEKLEELDELEIDKIGNIFSEMKDELPVGARTIYHPVRLALTGMTSGPELTEVIYILGRKEVESRLVKALKLAK